MLRTTCINNQKAINKTNATPHNKVHVKHTHTNPNFAAIQPPTTGPTNIPHAYATLNNEYACPYAPPPNVSTFDASSGISGTIQIAILDPNSMRVMISMGMVGANAIQGSPASDAIMKPSEDVRLRPHRSDTFPAMTETITFGITMAMSMRPVVDSVSENVSLKK